MDILVLNANNVDPDQTLHSVASDLGLHSLQITLFLCFSTKMGKFRFYVCKDKVPDWTVHTLFHTAHTVITLSIWTPYLLTILLLKFEIVHSTTC